MGGDSLDLEDLEPRELEPAASPLLAPEPAHEAPPRRRGRARWVALAVVGALALGAGWVARGFLGARATLAFRDAAGRSKLLEPLHGTTTPGTREEVAAFPGFAVSVETEPPGALVSIQGIARGEAPVLADVECGGGERIVIAARKPGYAPATAIVTCRRDALVKLTVGLGR